MDLQKEFEKFFKLFPEGNPKFAFNEYEKVIGEKTYFGDEITPKLLYSRYSNYIKVMKPLQSGTYTKRENKLLKPYDWLLGHDFDIEKQSMDSSVTKNDRYLYGIK